MMNSQFHHRHDFFSVHFARFLEAEGGVQLPCCLILGFAKHQRKKLARAGIEVDSVSVGGREYRVLKYTDDDGNVSYVAADADDAAEIKTKVGDADVADFETKLQTDNDFLTKYHDGTATWRTSVAQAFDKIGNRVFEKLHVSRNTFGDEVKKKAPADGDYDTAKKAVDEDFQEDFEKATTGDTDIEASKHAKDEDEDGKITVDEEVGKTPFAGETTEEGITQKLTEDDGAVAKATDSDDMSGPSAAGIFSTVAQGTCQAYNILVGMNRMIKAYEKAQAVVVGMKVLEAIQRMQAGDGGGDVIADVVGNNLTEVVEQTVKLQSSSDTFEEKTITLRDSVMSGAAIQAIYGGSQLTSNNAAVKAVIVPESSIRRILNTIGTNSGTGYRVCSVTNLAANSVDVVLNIMSLESIQLASMLVSFAKGAVKAIVVAGLVSFFVPRIAKMLTREAPEFIKGAIGGVVLSWATTSVLSKNAQASGFRPATQHTLIKYAKLKDEVIAEEVRYAQATKSPFDISSPYTFMGSLIRTLGASIVSVNSLTTAVNTFTNTATKSLTAFIPAANAANRTADDLASLGECGDLNALNAGSDNMALGDATCEMVPVGNTTKNGVSPEKVVTYLQDATCTNSEIGKKAFGDNFDPDAENFDKNLNIEDGSCLGKFITEYTEREAPLGEPDENIANSYKKGTGNILLDSAGSLVTFGVLDLINSFEDTIHLDNTLGREYTDPSSPNAEYYDMAEQFVNTERMWEAASNGEEQSAVTRFLDKYYKEHPLDDSFEGRLARYSGLSKEKISYLLDVGEEMVFLAGYNPDGYYPLAYHAEDKTPKIEIKDNQGTNVFIVNIPYIILENYQGKKDITA